MVDAVMKTGINRVLRESFPHLLQPAFVYARITKAQNESVPYTYNLKILDKFGNVDSSFPEIPAVRSRIHAEKGDTVAVALLYGKLNPFIVGVMS
jgi:hypothetical protein|nr:MAG TPA: hypothetical protein [Caudoviricetes sp.]